MTYFFADQEMLSIVDAMVEKRSKQKNDCCKVVASRGRALDKAGRWTMLLTLIGKMVSGY